jgi:hypothetical protein
MNQSEGKMKISKDTINGKLIMKKKSTEKILCCKFCQKNFKKRSNMKVHQRIHVLI